MKIQNLVHECLYYKYTNKKISFFTYSYMHCKHLSVESVIAQANLKNHTQFFEKFCKPQQGS